MLLNLWAFGLTGSRGALLGLLTGIGFLAVVCLFWGRIRRVRFAAACLLGFLSCIVGSIVFFTFTPLTSSIDMFSNPLLERVLTINKGNRRDKGSSYLDRMEAWRTGVNGFLEKPWLGWGPENFLVVFGRYASEYGSKIDVHSHAHNKFIEDASTKGILGLSTYLALWTYTFVIVVGGYRTIDTKDRLLPLFVGAALAGYFIQSQLSVPAISSSLQHTVLLIFVAHLETIGKKPSLYERRWAFVSYNWMSAVGVVGILILVGFGVFTNQAIYSAAYSTKKIYNSSNTPSRSIDYIKQAIIQFEPLANTPRNALFENFSKLWPALRTRDRVAAERLLALAEIEAISALTIEPENWRIHNSLAAMYRVVAVDNAEYEYMARRYSEQARDLAPRCIETLPPIQLEADFSAQIPVAES